MRTEFVILGEPAGKGRHRTANRGKYSVQYPDEKTVMYENLVKTEYRRQCNDYKFDPDVPIDCRIYAYYSIPKSTSKKKRDLMLRGLIRPMKKPDWDNIGKVICDALNKIAYNDDAQVADAMVRKFYSDTPRVIVIIQEAKHDEQNR